MDSEIPDSTTRVELTGFLTAIIRQFSQVTTTRLHNIAFLSEYAHQELFNDRITETPYFRVFDGCRSDQLSEILEQSALK